MFMLQYDLNLTYRFEHELPHLPPRGSNVILASFIRKKKKMMQNLWYVGNKKQHVIRSIL